MESSLGQAYYDVYSSFKQILDKNQRHLFCNMLDLLSSACKNSSAIINVKKISNDELTQFWFGDILPLLFDENSAIQSSAVFALEQGLSTLNIEDMHRSSKWPEVKSKIISTLAPLVHQLRENRNEHWHRIWCLLVKVLDREILRGASTINSLLSIVELGFRSPDSKVRAEAFLCWRLLIQLFHTHNQLCSPKRLKLICIPLKSSQSKTSNGAEVKLRVWWYLITCLGRSAEQHFESVVEPFLTFCVGNTNTSGAIHKYKPVRDIALPCLAMLLTSEPERFLEQVLREYKLEIPCEPFSLIDVASLDKHWAIIAKVIVAIVSLLANEDELSDIEHNLLNLFLRFATVTMLQMDEAPIFSYLSDAFVRLIPTNAFPAVTVLNALAKDGLRLNRSLHDVENYISTLKSIVKLLISAKVVTAPDVLQRCVYQVFASRISDCSQGTWTLVTAIINVVLQTDDDEGYESFQVKLLIWGCVSRALLHYPKQEEFNRVSAEYYKILYPWLLWPLKKLIDFVGNTKIVSMDKTQCVTWQELLQIGAQSADKNQYFDGIKDTLSNMLDTGNAETVICNLLEAYANSVMQLDASSENYRHYESVLRVLEKAVNKCKVQKELEVCLNNLLNIFRVLDQSGGWQLFELIKAILQTGIKSALKFDIDKTWYNRWKHSILDVARNYSDKKIYSETSEILSGDDVFVIIPSVWSLNPEKLTERQKERYSEKTNIPALYNDMSQSQDSLIKPWTPKKIVIAKENQNEIVLEKAKENEFFAEPNKFQLNSQHRGPVILSQVNLNDTQGTLHKYTDELEAHKHFDKSNSVNSNEIAQYIQDEDILNSLCKENDNAPGEMADATSDFQLERSGANERIETLHKTCTNIEECQNNLGLDDKHANAKEVLLSKEVSPKKHILKPVVFSSPPDRKLTSNINSPKIRPKPTHLTGRGAQLINMIRNKKPDISQVIQSSATRMAGKTATEAESVTDELSSTLSHDKDILTFSKRLPSPSASPSTSILKRPLEILRKENMEDTCFDSPACKKKRVSFHDPPVSVTKEYVKDLEENRTKSKRCLALDKAHMTTEKSADNRHALKRRGKLDSFNEIEKFTSVQSTKCAPTTTEPENSGSSSCRMKDVTPSSYEHNSYEEQSGSFPNLECKDDGAIAKNAFNIVMDHYTIEEILEKFLTSSPDSELKTFSTLAKLTSRHMRDNPKIQSTVLETLSESHSMEFLDHALRENLASVVCDRLNLPSVIEYICEKSKINAVCRNNLLSQLPDILKYSKQKSEPVELLKQILNNIQLVDNDILEIMTILLKIRSNNTCNSALVSEPSIDSSSNL